MSRPYGSVNEKASVKYSKTIFKQICDRIAQGESLRRICREEGYPSASAVVQWVMDDKDNCSKQYVRAREIQAMLMLDEIREIADDGTSDFLKLDRDGNPVMDKEFAARSKLRVDTLKWSMSKVLPKVYGDKLDLHHAGKVEVELSGVSILLAAAKNNQDDVSIEEPEDSDAESEADS